MLLLPPPPAAERCFFSATENLAWCGSEHFILSFFSFSFQAYFVCVCDHNISLNFTAGLDSTGTSM
jgi:hypothetical protein